MQIVVPPWVFFPPLRGERETRPSFRTLISSGSAGSGTATSPVSGGEYYMILQLEK